MKSSTTNIKPKPEDFIFCYNKEGVPTTLVMLRSVQHILKVLLTDIEEPYYFWIHKNKSQINEIIKASPQQVQSRSERFETFAEMEQKTKNKTKYKKIILICSSENKNQVIIFSRRVRYLGLIQIINIPMKLQSQQQLQEVGKQNVVDPYQQIPLQEIKKKSFNQQEQKIIKCKNQNDVNHALVYNKWNFSDIKFFPNFVIFKETQKCHYMVQNMNAILRTELDKNTRAQVIQYLENVASSLQKFHSKLKYRGQGLKIVFQQLSKGQLSAKRVIQIYTSEDNCFYVLINNFLRSMSCPTQIFYIQPFFVNLFQAIKVMSKPTQKRLICYRGASVTPEQFQKLVESVGQIVQNLGFLSTSTKQESALQFKINAMYEIRVQNQIDHTIKHNYGFASVSEWSQYIFESEVLFNPLNYFKVLEVKRYSIKIKNTKEQQIDYHLVLNLGEVTNMHSKDEKDLNQNQKVIKNFVSIHEKMQENYISQGLALMKNQQLQTALIYWKKYLDLINGGRLYQKIQNQSNKIRNFYLKNSFIALNSMSVILSKLGRSQQSIIYSNDCLNFCKKYLRYEKYYIIAFLNVATSLAENEKCQQAQAMFKKIKNMVVNENKFSQLQGEVNDNLASVLAKNGKFSQSLKIHDQCLKLKKKQFGEYDRSYLHTLNNKAVTLFNCGRYQEALKIYYGSIQIQYQLFGENNYEYLTKLNNMASSLFMAKKFQQAIYLIQKCILLKKKTFGQEHQTYLSSLKNKALMLVWLENDEQAEALLKQCQRKIKKNLGPGNIASYFSILNGLGIIYEKKKYYHQAIVIYKQSLKIAGQKMSSQGLDYIKTAIKVANILQLLNQRQESLKVMIQCEQALKKYNSEIFQEIILINKQIGIYLLRIQKFKKAHTYFQRCEQMSIEIFGKANRKTIKFFLFILSSLSRNGRQAQALQLGKDYRQKISQMFRKQDVESTMIQQFIVSRQLSIGLYQEARIQYTLMFKLDNKAFYLLALSVMLEKIFRLKQSLLFSKNLQSLLYSKSSLRKTQNFSFKNKKIITQHHQKTKAKLKIQQKKRNVFLQFQI